MNLYLLQYNNYYNRLFKREDDLTGYMSYKLQGAVVQNPLKKVNFIPNDGVITEQVINWDGATPDYVLVVEENNTIVSRWFIIESVRLRNG